MNKIKKIVLIFMGVVALCGALFLQEQKAGLFCGGIGTSALQPKKIQPNFAEAPLQGVGNRAYSLTEVFRQESYHYSIPFGTTDGDFLWRQSNNTIEKMGGSVLDDSVLAKLEEWGSAQTCIGLLAADDFTSNIQNFMSGLSTTVVQFMGNILSLTFNSKLICSSTETKGCVDLLGVIGGKTVGNTGIIGRLSNGIFIPFSLFTFLLVGLYITYKGIVKGEFRDSLGQTIFSIVVFIIGVAITLNPWIVANAPQTVTSTVSTCVISAFSGGNCLEEHQSALEFDGYDTSCKSYVIGKSSLDTDMQLNLTGMNCGLQKGFIMDNWAQQQFGYAFNELYTISAPNGYNNYTNIVGKAEDYCVNLYANESPYVLKSRESVTLSGEKQICNIAAAFMSNRTIGNFGTTANMAQIIGTATKDQRMWSAFTGNNRDLLGLTHLLSIIVLSLTFIPTATMTNVWLFSSIILLVFSPIFFFLGTIPGRGKKLFFGYLESLLGNLLKYTVASVVVLVMAVLYSSVLSSLSGALSLLVAIILALVMGNYRKEIIDVIGKVDMGGTQLANGFKERWDKVGKSTKKGARAIAGGTIGGMLAKKEELEDSGLPAHKKVGKILKGGFQGAGRGLSNSLRLGTGLTASAFRVKQQLDRDNAKARQEVERGKQAREQSAKIQESFDKSLDKVAEIVESGKQQVNQNIQQANHINLNLNQVVNENEGGYFDETLKEQAKTISSSNSSLDEKEVQSNKLVEKSKVNKKLGKISNDPMSNKENYIKQTEKENQFEDELTKRRIDFSNLSPEDYLAVKQKAREDYMKLRVEYTQQIDDEIKIEDDRLVADIDRLYNLDKQFESKLDKLFDEVNFVAQNGKIEIEEENEKGA